MGDRKYRQLPKLMIEEWIIAVALFIMSTVCILNVLSRYVLHFSISFTEELVVYMFAYASMIGASVACAKGANMGMDAVVKLFPKKLQIFMLWLAVIISSVLFSLLLYYGMVAVMSQMKFGIRTPMLDLPKWLFTLSMPIGSAFYIVRVIQKGIKDTKSFYGVLIEKEGDCE